MNEILAIIVVAYFAERVESKREFDKMSPEEIAEDNELLTEFIFDARHTFADVYAVFNSVMQFGVKNLYQETKDISELRKELVYPYCNS